MTDGRLIDALGIGAASCVALIGGGGKTTLMLAVAAELESEGCRPVVTTTTRIRPPPHIPLILGARTLLDASRDTGSVCWGRGLNSEGKVEGVEPASVCELAAGGGLPVLVEADGSAGRPLKVHAAHEPVVPACATDVLIVAGMDALGCAADDRVIHRAALMEKGAASVVTPALVARLLGAMERFAPPGARSWFVLNKTDGEAQRRAAMDVGQRLAEFGSGVILTSWGHVCAAPRKKVRTGSIRA